MDQFRAMGAALRSGERPNLVEVTNREVVGALFAMIRHYEAKGESATVPPPLHVSPVPYSVLASCGWWSRGCAACACRSR